MPWYSSLSRCSAPEEYFLLLRKHEVRSAGCYLKQVSTYWLLDYVNCCSLPKTNPTEEKDWVGLPQHPELPDAAEWQQLLGNLLPAPLHILSLTRGCWYRHNQPIQHTAPLQTAPFMWMSTSKQSALQQMRMTAGGRGLIHSQNMSFSQRQDQHCWPYQTTPALPLPSW